MTADPLAAIRATFFIECEELLEGFQDALNAMSDGRGDTEAINTIFRAVHSIKGGAGTFGFDALVGFAHRLETVLDHLRAGRVQPTTEMVKHLFNAADLLQDHVRAAREGAAPPSGEAVLRMLEGDTAVADISSMIDFTPTALFLDDWPAEAPAPQGPRWWTIRFIPHARLYTSGNEALLVLRALCALGRASVACDIPDDLSLADDAAEQPRLGWRIKLEAEADRAEIEEVFDFVADICEVEIAEGREIHATPTGKREDATDIHPTPAHLPPPTLEVATTIRVDLQKIDGLVNLVGELVINQAMLSQSIGQAGLGNAQIAAGLEAFLTLTRDLQDSVMSVRAQPVKPLFQRMARVVREASVALGKEVRLKTEGEATEVDRTVIERLAEPLTHMIRNAMDHGLEDPQARLAAGKSRDGQITLSAFHRADRIVIEVADDGAGIDRGKVLATARAQGLAMDAALTPAEIDNLMFLPGFSTAAGVSALSGRGVGMDVVKCAVAALGGRISVASEPGRGTIFSLSLPLTLAVLDGLVVQAAGQTFVVPLSTIVETAALGTAAMRKVGPDTVLLQVRGKLVPVVDLGARLGFRHAATPRRNGIVLLTGQDEGPRSALIVDAVLEQRQVVIKGLGPGIERTPGVAAATILGDGRIALILDPAGLTQSPGNADIALAG